MPYGDSGFVYVMRADDGLCKIGRSQQLCKRIKTVEHAYGVRIIDVWSRWFDCAYEAEWHLHQTWAHCGVDVHGGREWFRFSGIELDAVLAKLDIWFDATWTGETSINGTNGPRLGEWSFASTDELAGLRLQTLRQALSQMAKAWAGLEVVHEL